jgi:hypothetical protein
MLNTLSAFAKRMLVAGHSKPWKDSAPSERMDPRNGLAACPSHDVAFDTGLLTVGSCAASPRSFRPAMPPCCWACRREGSADCEAGRQDSPPLPRAEPARNAVLTPCPSASRQN